MHFLPYIFAMQQQYDISLQDCYYTYIYLTIVDFHLRRYWIGEDKFIIEKTKGDIISAR